MTLNITVVSSSGIHQSADFRISKTEKDANGNWVELQPNSTKIVPLQYQKWFGFVTYCGIGLWSGKSTDQYAVEWLADLAPTQPTFREVVERIRARGSHWLGGINRGRKEPFGHSFVVAGFEAGVPIYAIVSNIQSLTEYFRSLSNELRADVRATKDLHLLITGIREAVSEEAQSRLKAVVRSGAAPNVIRYEMAEVNRIASKSSEARNGISPACLAYSIDEHGAGHGEVHGDVQGPVMPRTVLGGIDISAMLAEVLKSNPGAKLVQTAYATTRSNQADLQEHIECKLQFKASELCAVEEIGAINEYWLSLQATNDNGWLVGHLRYPIDSPFHAFVGTPGREIRDLGTFGGPFSHAFSVNEKIQVVGSADVDHHVTHAFLWDESGGMRDLGTLGGIRSVARDINNREQVVGESFVNAGAPRHEYERAFLWSPDGGMINLGQSFESWSRAIGINDHGVVIGWRQRGHVVCGFLWSQERGATDILGLSGRGFYPSAINDDGLVVGEGDDNAGRRRAFTWTLDGGLKQLAVPDEFHPTDIDAYGNVLGNVYSQPWQQPGIYETVRGRYFELPAAYNHQTSVTAMNRNGMITGVAHTRSSKHSHPLIWRLLRH
jgi:probable HAF family extracellular repeat protein